MMGQPLESGQRWPVNDWTYQVFATSAATPDLPENIKNAAVFVSNARLMNGPLSWPKKLQPEKQRSAVMSKSREQDKFVLRLPDGLRDCIATLAGDNHRSMNSEIINRLERSIVSKDLCVMLAQLIQQLSARMWELKNRVPESISVLSTTLPAGSVSTLRCHQAREQSGSGAVL